MQYYVRKDKLDKMAKIAGMTSKDSVKTQHGTDP